MLLLFRKKTLKGLTGYKGAFRKDIDSLGCKKDNQKKHPTFPGIKVRESFMIKID
jgi:hypothetical protein